MALNDLGFKGLSLGKIQNVDEMTVIPIFGPAMQVVSPPRALKFEGTTGYGNMVFRNESDDLPALVPANVSIMSKQAAQDHAMSGSDLVEPLRVTSFTNACCVERSQGGYLGDHSLEESNILPLGLRRTLLNWPLREQKQYSKLWPAISEWLPDKGRAHLRDFYDKYDKELNEFVAEFEPENNQIGAFIFFKSRIAGLEIFPTPEHWDMWWKPLIRGCYGAELIRLLKSGKMQHEKIEFSLVEESLDGLELEMRSNLLTFQMQLESSTEAWDLFERDEYRITKNKSLTMSLVTLKDKSSGLMGGGDVLYADVIPGMEFEYAVPVYTSLVFEVNKES